MNFCGYENKFCFDRMYEVNQELVKISRQWRHHEQSCKDINQHSMYKEMTEIGYC